MPLDDTQLDKLFKEAADNAATKLRQEEEAKNPLLKIWNRYAEEFEADNSFIVDIDRLRSERPQLLIFSSKDPDNNVSITFNTNGTNTFCINGNGSEAYNERPPEEVVKALGWFLGTYKGTAPATAQSTSSSNNRAYLELGGGME